MRRTASEVIRELEMRVARLEGNRGMGRRASWDDPENYNHPMMKVVRSLEGKKIGKWELEESFSGASMWTNGMDEIYVTYESRATTFIFTREGEDGRPEVVGRINVGRGGNDSASDFLKASAKVLRSL
jgi:hypothetical protein